MYNHTIQDYEFSVNINAIRYNVNKKIRNVKK